jgi:hypothetical protein
MSTISIQIHGHIEQLARFVRVGSQPYERVVIEDPRCGPCNRDTCAHCQVETEETKYRLVRIPA